MPTDGPESDGTLKWDSTSLVLVEVRAADMTGLGFTYASKSTALFIDDKLRDVVVGQNAMDVQRACELMVCSARNLGRAGQTAMGVAAVDSALWDLKSRLLKLPLVSLLGQVRTGIPAYGSGGFTSYSTDRLRNQLGDWARIGFGAVKMKIGRDPDKDIERVRAAREAIAPTTKLYVDANGAYSPKQALEQAHALEEYGVAWFEEPVTSDDLEGLGIVRKGAPASMVIAAGEYGYDPVYFRNMLEAGSVERISRNCARALA